MTIISNIISLLWVYEYHNILFCYYFKDYTSGSILWSSAAAVLHISLIIAFRMIFLMILYLLIIYVVDSRLLKGGGEFSFSPKCNKFWIIYIKLYIQRTQKNNVYFKSAVLIKTMNSIWIFHKKNVVILTNLY